MHTIWQAANKNDLEHLDDEERLFAKIMLEHKDQYYNEFEHADLLEDYEFDPETETNPFLHIIIHSVVETQLQEKDPIETYQFFNAMMNKRANRHDVLHIIGYIFTHFLFPILKEGKPFDEEMYIKALKFFMNSNSIKQILFRTLKIISKLVAILLLLILLLVAVLNIPLVQTYVTQKIAQIISDDYGVDFQVGGVMVAIPNTLQIHDLFVPGQSVDTLLYLGTLKADLSLLRLINREVQVRYFSLENLRANVKRGLPGEAFNFDFLLEAFASEPDSTAKPDTTLIKPWDISIDRINLEDIHAIFLDETAGMDAKLKLGKLDITFDELNMDGTAVLIDRIELSDTYASYEQWAVEHNEPPGEDVPEKATSEKATQPDSSLPLVGLEALLLENVKIDFFDQSSKMKMQYETGFTLVEPGETNLKTNRLVAKNIEIAQTKAFIEIATDTTSPVPAETAAPQTPEKKSVPAFVFMPGWNIEVAKVSFDDMEFGFDDVHAPPVEFGMDFAHLHFENINVHIDDIILSDSIAAAHIRQVTLTEHNGLDLDQLQLDARVSSKKAEIKRLEVKLNETELFGDFIGKYEDFNLAFTDPGKVAVDIDLWVKHLKPELITLFALSQDMDSTFAMLRQKQLNLTLKANGKVDDLLLDKLEVTALDQTQILASGTLQNLTRPDDLFFDLDFYTIRTGKSDANAVLGSALPQNFHLPDSIAGGLYVRGTPAGAEANLSLNTDFGAISADAFFKRAFKQHADTFAVQFKLDGLQLGEILQIDQLGEVSLALGAGGSGLEAGTISANAYANITKATYNGYNYNDIRMEANMHNSLIWMKIISDNPGAQLVFETSASVDSTIRDISLLMNLENLNLRALHFTDEEIAVKTTLKLTGDYMNMDDLKGELTLDNTLIINKNESFPIDEIRFSPLFTPEQTYMEFTSGILKFHFDSNIPFDDFENVMMASMSQYFNRAEEYAVDPEKTLEFRAYLSIPEYFKSNFLPDLKEVSIDTIIGRYSAAENRMNLKIKVTMIDYAGALLENLHLDLSGLQDSLSVVAGIERLSYDSLYVNGLSITESLFAGKLTSDISLKNKHDSTAYRIANEISITENGNRVSFLVNDLVLNGKAWDVPPENNLTISDTGWIAKDFVFSSEGQQAGVGFVNQTGNFFTKDFQLSNLLGIIQSNGPDNLASGDLNLDLHIPFGRPYDGIRADINIMQLRVLDSLLGNLHFNLEEKTGELALDFKLDASNNYVKARGTISKSPENQPIDLDIDFDISEPAHFEAMLSEYVSDLSGSISGNFKLDGQLSSPAINGQLQFNDARITATMLNTGFYLPNEHIVINNSNIIFNDFDIFDSNDDKLNINGKLITNNFNDIEFDLNVNTLDFQPINSSKSDNKMLYGSMVIDADLNLKGDLDLPVVDVNLAIKAGTDITYVLPGSEIEIVTSEGIVNFINPVADTVFESAGGDYLTDSILSKVRGIDLTAKLDLSDKAKFTVVIDPYSGDYASVQGSATMNYSIDPSASQTLTGVFEVSTGVYQLSFYGLVKKTFEFEPGSSIAWSGQPLDANINFTAKHVVRTQSVALVANESTSMTEAEKNMFKQRLPYEVLLNLRGFIDEPDVSFHIELPEKYQINYPQITSKLNMLNSAQNESELNKQVFALLVSGSFIADNPFASSGGSAENFATTAARNSVNGILAQQLNNISSRYIKGVEMNFGLTTYEDYSGSSSDTRTELDIQVSKKLLDERLTVEASGSFDVEGSRQYSGANPSHTYGEFSATYDLTESREYKLRAYRENAYDLFEGEVAYSGIAFIIEKSFDKLFKRTKKTENPNKDDNEQPQPETENEEGNE